MNICSRTLNAVLKPCPTCGNGPCVVYPPEGGEPFVVVSKPIQIGDLLPPQGQDAITKAQSHQASARTFARDATQQLEKLLRSASELSARIGRLDTAAPGIADRARRIAPHLLAEADHIATILGRTT